MKREVKHIPSGQTGKIMALSWGPAENDSRMAICDQEGACFIWETQRTTPLRMRLRCPIHTVSCP